MKTKGYLLLGNWVIFFLLVSAMGIVIPMGISASYFPNNPRAPYYAAFINLWLVAVPVSFLLAVVLSILRKRLSVRRMVMGTAGVYGILALIATISILLVEPVPNYFMQSTDNRKYQVPREFVEFQVHNSGILISMCVGTLKGIYDPNRGGCDSETVTLSMASLYRAAHPTLPAFLEEVNEFDIEGDRVISLTGSEQYQVQSPDGLKSYTIDNPWPQTEIPDAPEPLQLRYEPVHFQTNDRDELVRFVSCMQLKNEVGSCEHWVKTEQGVLGYTLEGSVAFDLENWQKTDQKILNLIAQWEIN